MKKLLVIDLNNIIYRAFFGLNQPLKTPEGLLVNAVYGVFNILFAAINDLKPTTIIACLDSQDSQRKAEYSEYKSNRSKMPDDLRKQIPLIYELLTSMGIPLIKENGLEADDLIYTVCQKSQEFDEVFILSGDKDLMQLIDDKIKTYDSMKQKKYGIKEVQEKFGVLPTQIVDFLAILGDSSDCIPGVSGIGEKGASKLLNQFGSLEEIYNQIDSVTPEGIKNKLITGKESAFLSQNLARLRMCSVDIELNNWSLNKQEVITTLEKWNMKTAISKIKDF